MLKLQKLNSLARLLCTELIQLKAITDQSQNLYFEKTRLKKDGTKRTINPPQEKLKIIQRRILDKILIQIPISPHAYGWVKGKSRFDCVTGHTNKKIVYTADISDFFPSIHYRRIYKLFNEKFNYSPDVSRILTQLTTYKFSLPQGAPTSPQLTNIILKFFDDELFPYWSKRGAYYSRFGDDIIVSSNHKLKSFKQIISSRIRSYGLKVNLKKFCVMKHTMQQKALGLVVNEKVSIPKKEIIEIKKILHEAEKVGLGALNFNNHPSFKDHIAGRIVQVKIFNPNIGKKLWESFQKLKG